MTPLKQLDAAPRVLAQSADSLQQVLAAGAMAPAALSAPTTAAMLESSLSQLQQHLDNLTAQSGQQQTLELQQTDFADLLHGFDASSNTRALAVDQLSDVAFMALAAESTAAAEATAAAVEAAANAGKQPAQSDSLLDTLRTNLEVWVLEHWCPAARADVLRRLSQSCCVVQTQLHNLPAWHGHDNLNKRALISDYLLSKLYLVEKCSLAFR